MVVSLKYIYTKLKGHYPDVEIYAVGGRNPVFEGVRLYSADQISERKYLYIYHPDCGAAGMEHEEISIVLPQRAAAKFPAANRVIFGSDFAFDEVMNFIIAVMDEFKNWYERVSKAVIENKPLQEILNLTYALVRRPMYFADASFKMLDHVSDEMEEVSVIWRYQLRHAYLPYDVISKLNETGEMELLSNAPHAFLNKTQSFVLGFISKSIRYHGQHIGFFFIINLYGDLDVCHAEIAEALGELIGAADVNTHNYLAISTSYHEHFMVDILQGTLTDEMVITHRLKPLGWGIEDRYLIAITESEREQEMLRRHVMSMLVEGQDAQVFYYHGYIVAMYNLKRRGANEIREHLMKHTETYDRLIALSEEFSRFDKMPLYYKQACFLTEHYSTGKGGLANYVEHAMDHILSFSEPKIPPHMAVEVLQRHDLHYQTDYCLTLYTFLIHERSASKTAHDLFLHRNTLKYRLDKIMDLIDLDLENPQVRYRLISSLHPIARDASPHEQGADNSKAYPYNTMFID